ncbi:thioredoxin H2-like [Malania oleifera]|uniref:thioredoxin H2-like n=1 Tax=Malania oleifera TaxID=397392 RepID=UPI0025AE0C57|nr:thioredoxin H2-like [Malania oleifera]
MVSNVSNFQYTGRTVQPVTTISPSPIIAFHTSAQWKAHFNACKETPKLMVIDFTATWCGPCRFMEPALKEFASKYTDVEFIKVDVDELADVARQFQIQAMPTFLLIKNGKVLDQVVGAKKDELKQKIEKNRVSDALKQTFNYEFRPKVVTPYYA